MNKLDVFANEVDNAKQRLIRAYMDLGMKPDNPIARDFNEAIAKLDQIHASTLIGSRVFWDKTRDF
jgi:hypothetical protein